MTTDAEWTEVADELIGAARQAEHDRLGRRVCQVVSGGRLAGLAHAIDARRTSGLPLAIEVLRADLAARDQTITFHRLRELDQRVQASELPAEYRWWMEAILAEWGLWRGDFSTFGYVHSETDRSNPATGGLAAMIEARRRRILALMLVVAAPTATATADAVDEVYELFASADVAEELAVTDVMLGYGRLAISDDSSTESVALIRRGVAELERLGADRLGVGLAFLAWGGYMVGDFATAASALDRSAAVTPTAPPLPPLAVDGVALLRSLAQMVIEGPTTRVLAELRLHFDRLRRSAVPAWMLAPVANDLLDAGQVEFAEELLDAIGPEDPFVLAADMILREVDARIRIARDGDHSAVADLWKLYGEFERTGRFRRAAASAVRCAWTCSAAGFEDDAARLTRWGLAMLPPETQRTPWEQAYIAGGDPAKRWTATRRGTLRVLAPLPVLTRDGDPVELEGELAVLVGVLAAATGTVRMIDLSATLWPDLDLSSGGVRLSETIRVLRERFDLLPGELIQIVGDEVELDSRGWSVDVREFWDLTDSGDDRRARAIDLYTADLVASLPAHDDLLAVERAVLRSRWLDALRSLVAGGHLTIADAEARFRHVAPDDDQVTFA